MSHYLLSHRLPLRRGVKRAIQPINIATITPTSSGNLEISIPENVAIDIAGNQNIASGLGYVTIGDLNVAPVFTDGGSTTREVAENTAAGENIGAAVAATDENSGNTLTYSLSGTDASSFSIVSGTGQLQTWCKYLNV
jgi:hypothetical protein